MKPTILYRGTEFEEQEFSHAVKAGIYCTNSRMEVRSRSLVVARYSCLPFYKELETDLAFSGSKLINSYAQHRYIADLQNWYQDLKGLTPETWTSVSDIPLNEDGPFVIKGETNSKKNLWNTHMFARDRKSIGRVMAALMEDSLIKSQNIYIRKYEPLVTYFHAINDLPITREFRFFIAYDEILSGGFYWSSHLEELIGDAYVKADDINFKKVPKEFLDKVIAKLKGKANGIVVDIAQRKSDGEWIVVECNDLQMAGLSENSPNILYQNLYRVLSSQSS